jgi:purine nucleosidase
VCLWLDRRTAGRHTRGRMGIPVVLDGDILARGRGIADCLALLCLLGSRAVDVLGVTTCFGSAPVDVVYRDVRSMLRLLGREEIPVFHGAPWPGFRATEAAHFLARTARERPGGLTVVATGPLSNLGAAADLARGFFADLGKVVCAGGVLGRPRAGWARIREGAFSADPEAARAVLGSRRPVTVLTADLAVQAPFGRGDLAATRGWPPWVRHALLRWARSAALRAVSVRLPLWDALPAAYVGRPELFEDRSRYCVSGMEDLGRGALLLADRAVGVVVNVPARVRDPAALRAHVIACVAASLGEGRAR